MPMQQNTATRPRVAVAVFMMAGGLGSNDRAKNAISRGAQLRRSPTRRAELQAKMTYFGANLTHKASSLSRIRGRQGRHAKSSGDAMGGDDLIGGAAGDLGHAVELPGKAAGAGRRRPQLHDQLADLGFRHHGADAVPSRPAFTGVETENLPSPPRQDRVDLRGGIGRTDDLHHVDRLQQYRLALRQSLADADPRRGAECEIGRVDGVI